MFDSLLLKNTKNTKNILSKKKEQFLENNKMMFSEFSMWSRMIFKNRNQINSLLLFLFSDRCGCPGQLLLARTNLMDPKINSRVNL